MPGGRLGAGLGGIGGIGGIVILLVILLTGGGGGLGDVLDDLEAQAPAGEATRVPGAPDPDRDLVDFLRAVDRDLQDFWSGYFADSGRTYERTQLILFTGATQTGCGVGSSRTGPFYCPLDRRAYIDLSFYRRVLAQDLGAPGDFAQAYVLAHEYGHHVQTLLGIDLEVRDRVRDEPGRRNDLSIRQELQADCLAGVWGHSVYRRNLLEPGDLEEALTAAAAVGDDRIQASVQGRVTPETWTHGSSEQRVQWFRAGFDSGDATSCDTFSEG
jgi:predicted metalloprotease